MWQKISDLRDEIFKNVLVQMKNEWDMAGRLMMEALVDDNWFMNDR